MQNTTQIKNLGLTVDDFDLLVKALQTMPAAGGMAEIMMDALTSKYPQNTPPHELAKMRQKRENLRKSQEEDCQVLQGKLIALKRILIQEDLLAEAERIVK